MLEAYVDESGSPDDTDVFVVAGLIASRDSWDALSAEWRCTLDRFGVGVFHASDCANGGGDFRGMQAEIRNRLIKDLVGITRKHASHRIWTVARMEDLRAAECLASIAYSLCAIGCASRLRSALLAPSNSLIPNVPYCFDRGAKGGQLAFNAFRDLGTGGYGERYRMGSVTKGNRHELVPLQAADLHAYETYRYFANQLCAGRPTRRSFIELMGIPEAGGGGYVITTEWLQFWKAKIAIGERSPDGSCDLPLRSLRTDSEVHLGG